MIGPAVLERKRQRVQLRLQLEIRSRRRRRGRGRSSLRQRDQLVHRLVERRSPANRPRESVTGPGSFDEVNAADVVEEFVHLRRQTDLILLAVEDVEIARQFLNFRQPRRVFLRIERRLEAFGGTDVVIGRQVRAEPKTQSARKCGRRRGGEHFVDHRRAR